MVVSWHDHLDTSWQVDAVYQAEFWSSGPGGLSKRTAAISGCDIEAAIAWARAEASRTGEAPVIWLRIEYDPEVGAGRVRLFGTDPSEAHEGS